MILNHITHNKIQIPVKFSNFSLAKFYQATGKSLSDVLLVFGGKNENEFLNKVYENYDMFEQLFYYAIQSGCLAEKKEQLSFEECQVIIDDNLFQFIKIMFGDLAKRTESNGPSKSIKKK